MKLIHFMTEQSETKNDVDMNISREVGEEVVLKITDARRKNYIQKGERL